MNAEKLRAIVVGDVDTVVGVRSVWDHLVHERERWDVPVDDLGERRGRERRRVAVVVVVVGIVPSLSRVRQVLHRAGPVDVPRLLGIHRPVVRRLELVQTAQVHQQMRREHHQPRASGAIRRRGGDPKDVALGRDGDAESA